jgi:flagellar hook-length control protein FliK
MTIEKSPTSTQQTNTRTSAHGVKGKSATADASTDSGSAGFMSILGSLGDDGTDAATMAAPAGADAAQSALLPGAAVPPFDASTLLQQNPQIGQQAAWLAATAAPVAGTGSDANATLAAGAPHKALPGAATEKSTSAQSAPLLSGAEPLAAESPTQNLQHVGAHGKAAKELLQGSADGSAQPNGGNANATPLADPKDKLMAALQQAKELQPSKSPEFVPAPLLAKPEKSTSERTAQAGKISEPGYSGTTLGVSAPDYSQSVAQAPALTPDMQVAEQVTYWVTHNVQNAEMKLDGFGQSPVEVSIQVQGNEAQIAFRSDEAATRGVLESAGAHLTDMLQREGMVLTGVSVGTSGSGDSSAGQRQARQSARQGLVAPLKVETVEPGRRMAAASGRSVDLFV